MNYYNYAKRYVDFFETLDKNTSYEEYKNIFIKDVYFEDPFQKTYDLKSLHKIFIHMYETLYEPKFYIKEFALTNNSVYIQWMFKYKKEKIGESYSFLGVSHVCFNKEGKVISHIDYWDSGTNIYEKIPLLGSLIRFIKNRIKA